MCDTVPNKGAHTLAQPLSRSLLFSPFFSLFPSSKTTRANNTL